MAGKVPYSETREFNPQILKSPSCSSEEFSAFGREHIGDILPISRTWSKLSGCSSDVSNQNQLQEQYMFSINQCLAELKNIKRKNETMFIQVKKTVRDKIESMLKIVKQSFEYMHSEGTKQIETKCEEIGRVLARVEKLLEEENKDLPTETVDHERESPSSSQKFLEKSLKEKSRIELEVEAIIIKLNQKRENDEQIFMDFKEEIQQQVQNGFSCIERSLDSHAEHQAEAVDEKIKELRKAFANLQHLSKFS